MKFTRLQFQPVISALLAHSFVIIAHLHAPVNGFLHIFTFYGKLLIGKLLTYGKLFIGNPFIYGKNTYCKVPKTAPSADIVRVASIGRLPPRYSSSIYISTTTCQHKGKAEPNIWIPPSLLTFYASKLSCTVTPSFPCASLYIQSAVCIYSLSYFTVALVLMPAFLMIFFTLARFLALAFCGRVTFIDALVFLNAWVLIFLMAVPKNTTFFNFLHP